MALGAFVAIAYALSWSWTFPFAALGEVIEKGKGWPTNEPAVFGPALAAFTVTAWLCGRKGVAALVARMGRWRMPLRWWTATLSPLWFLAVALVVAAATANMPTFSDFGRYSGLPAVGGVAVALLAIVGAFGEETGWRGFALPLLQRRYGALTSALLVTPIWALWHLPFFFTVETYRSFPTVGYVGFVFGLACAIWHGVYNLETGTAAANGTIQAVTTTLVIVQAVAVVGLELRARKRGLHPAVGEGPTA